MVLTTLLPSSWQPFAKYMFPSIIVLLGTLAYSLIDWQLDAAQLEVGLTGLVTTLVAFAVANGSAGWKRFAKAVASASTGLAIVLIHSLVVWDWDPTSTRTAATAVVTAVLVYLVPNIGALRPEFRNANASVPAMNVTDLNPQ